VKVQVILDNYFAISCRTALFLAWNLISIIHTDLASAVIRRRLLEALKYWN